MSYADAAALARMMPERTLIELSNDNAPALVADATVIADALLYADALVDARLRQRYTLPLAEVPVEVTQWALALARHWLYARRPDGPDLPIAVTAAYKEALTSLDAVRDGKLSLGLPSGDAAAEPGRVVVAAPERTFTDAMWNTY